MIETLVAAVMIGFGTTTHIAVQKLEKANEVREMKALEDFSYRKTMKSVYGVPVTKAKGNKPMTIRDLK